MKRYIRSSDSVGHSSTPMEYDIDVIIVPKYSDGEIAAAMHKGITIPDGDVIPGIKDAIITDKIEVDYNAFIESLEDLLTEYYGLELFYEGKSEYYSHYYFFLAKDKESGRIYFKFKLRLRISNHPAHRSPASQAHKKEETMTEKYKELTKDISKDPRPYTKEIVVNDQTYDSYEAAFVDIDEQISEWIDVMKRR